MCQDLSSHPSKRFHPNVSIPPLLDVASLFNPDANSSMWMDVVLDDDNNSKSIPAYLADPKVQEGILGFLGLQRCKEEEARLVNEMDSMLCWMSSRINSIKKAQNICQGKGNSPLHCMVSIIDNISRSTSCISATDAARKYYSRRNKMDPPCW